MDLGILPYNFEPEFLEEEVMDRQEDSETVCEGIIEEAKCRCVWHQLY